MTAIRRSWFELPWMNAALPLKTMLRLAGAGMAIAVAGLDSGSAKGDRVVLPEDPVILPILDRIDVISSIGPIEDGGARAEARFAA